MGRTDLHFERQFKRVYSRKADAVLAPN